MNYHFNTYKERLTDRMGGITIDELSFQHMQGTINGLDAVPIRLAVCKQDRINGIFGGSVVHKRKLGEDFDDKHRLMISRYYRRGRCCWKQ